MTDKPMELTNDDVERILRLIEESTFDEIEIEWKGLRLRLSKGGGLSRTDTSKGVGETNIAEREAEGAARPLPASQSRLAEKSAPEAPQSARSTESGLTERRDTVASSGSGSFEVRAPIMGTFYRSPEPGKPPFVEIGSVVAAGETLCLLEVMKMFNGVQAPRAGCVTDVRPKEGQLVDYDDVLFLIEPL